MEQYRRHLHNTDWNLSFKEISTGRTSGSILLLSGGFIAAKIAPKYYCQLRACLHENGGPQIGEVTRLGRIKK